MRTQRANCESTDRFNSECLIEKIIDWKQQPEGDVTPLLMASRDLATTEAGSEDVTRRILICAQCSVLAWVEHDADLSARGVQDPTEIGGRCQPLPSHEEGVVTRFINALGILQLLIR